MIVTFSAYAEKLDRSELPGLSDRGNVFCLIERQYDGHLLTLLDRLPGCFLHRLVG
jgi:hypothetical protein